MENLKTKIAAILILGLALLGAPLNLASQERTFFTGFDKPGVSPSTDAQNSLIRFSRVTWFPIISSPTVCSFTVEKSFRGTVWTELIPAQDCSSEGKFEFITPVIHGLLRFRMITFTGAGTVLLFWEGFKGNACGADYRGIFSTIKSADPATGQELSIAIPSNERWRLYSAKFELQTTVAVGDREVFLIASEGENTYFRTFADGVVKADQKGIFTTASLGFVGTVGLGPLAITQAADERTIMIPIYSAAFIPGGDTIATDTSGMQSGDDYSAAVVKVERCPN